MIDHLPQPGPDYWSWRCLRCGEAARLHASPIRLLINRIARKEPHP